VACGQAAIGAGIAAVGLLTTVSSLAAADTLERWVALVFVLLVLECFVLPLAVAASISTRHYRIGERTGAGTAGQAAAPLLPAAFFAVGFFLLLEDQAYLAFLLMPAAPSAALLALALLYARGPYAWPSAAVGVGAGGVVVSLSLTLWFAASPASLIGSFGGGASVAASFVTPLLIIAFAQMALGALGRFMPLRLRRERPLEGV
jgi:hypothetical protein